MTIQFDRWTGRTRSTCVKKSPSADRKDDELYRINTRLSSILILLALLAILTGTCAVCLIGIALEAGR